MEEKNLYYILALSAFLIYALAYAKRDRGFAFQHKDNVYQHRDNVYLFVFFLFAALIMGLRSTQVGADTRHYEMLFDQIVATKWADIFSNLKGIKFEGLEIGFVVLAKTSGMLVNNYYIFQLLIACIYCFSMMSFFKDNVNSKIILTTVFLGGDLYLNAFNISRQMLAVAFTSLCWKSLCQGKKIRALVMIILAVTIHTSAIVFAVAFLVYLIRKKKILLFTVVFLGVIAALNYEVVIPFFADFFDVYWSYVPNNRHLLEMGASVLLYSVILILAIYILVKKRFYSIEKIYAVFSIAYVACIFVGLKFNYFERIGIYFLPFTVLLMDTIGTKIQSKDIALFYKIGVPVSYTAYFLLSSTSTQYVYHFLWSK